MHNDWKLESIRSHSQRASEVEAQFRSLVSVLRWEPILYKRAGGAVFFSYRKPFHRQLRNRKPA